MKDSFPERVSEGKTKGWGEKKKGGEKEKKRTTIAATTTTTAATKRTKARAVSMEVGARAVKGKCARRAAREGKGRRRQASFSFPPIAPTVSPRTN